MWTIAPPAPSSIARAASCDPTKADVRLSASTRCQSSSARSIAGARAIVPAFSTAISSDPSSRRRPPHRGARAVAVGEIRLHDERSATERLDLALHVGGGAALDERDVRPLARELERRSPGRCRGSRP